MDQQSEFSDDAALPGGSDRHRHRLLRAPILIGAAVGLVLIVGTAMLVIKHRRDTMPLALPHATITADRADSYRYRKVRNHITVSAAPDNQSYNLRTTFWLPESTPSMNQQVCMDWLIHDGRAQPGIALRVRPTADRSHADGIYVIQNVVFRNYWEIAVLGARDNHFITSSRLAVFDLKGFMIQQEPKVRMGTWHVCARVAGRSLSIKLWFPGQPEPGWQAGSGVLHATLPANWVWRGLPGAYVGHIKPNESFPFANLRTEELPNP